MWVALLPGVHERGAAEGDLALSGLQDVVIEGLAGAEATTIDCGLQGRGIDIAASSNVALRGLTVRSCLAEVGAGVRVVDSASVSLVDMRVQNNTACSAGGGLVRGEELA